LEKSLKVLINQFTSSLSINKLFRCLVTSDSWSFSYIIFKLQSSCYHTSREGNEDRKTK